METANDKQMFPIFTPFSSIERVGMGGMYSIWAIYTVKFLVNHYE